MRCAKAIVFLFSVTVAWATCCELAVAQQNNRSGFIRDLLKTYVDNRVQSQDWSEDSTSPGTRESTAANRAGVNPPVGRSAQSPQFAPQWTRAGELLTAASQEMKSLVDSLLNDVNRANGVRQLLNLAFQVNADAAVLSRQLAYTSDAEALRPALRQLDQDWRTLAYRLSQTRNLSAPTLGHVQRIQQHADQIGSMFQVQPQVDWNELGQRSVQMHQALRTLLQDIRYEVADRTTADRLFSAGRDTYEQLLRILRITRPGTQAGPQPSTQYDTLKQEFESLAGHWSTYQRVLRQADNRHLQRQIQRINDDMRSMHAMLYLDGDQVDRNELMHASSILRGDVDRLLQRVTLKMLTQLPVGRRYAIEAAGDLDQTCNDFSEMLHDEVDNIRDMFLYMSDEWQRLSLALQGASSQEARQAIRDVERSMADLQAMLGVRLELDRSAAINLATTLAGHARHLQGDVRDIFSRANRYPQNFQNDSLDEVARFEAATRTLYGALDRGERLQSLAVHTGNLGQSWQRMRQLFSQFSANDRMHLQQIERRVTPQVVQLQTLLTP